MPAPRLCAIIAMLLLSGCLRVELNGPVVGATVSVQELRGGKLVVDGVNMITRHKKPTQVDPNGGLEKREAPLYASKVALADPKDGKPTRVRFETVDGEKVRVGAHRRATPRGMAGATAVPLVLGLRQLLDGAVHSDGGVGVAPVDRALDPLAGFVAIAVQLDLY